MTALYDTIGLDYARLRRPDPRIQTKIDDALGESRTVLNVGAGAGSYEPKDRDVTALEPSAAMIAQRPLDAAPVVRGVAEALPFADDGFDAAMAVLSVHHWSDPAAGLREMRRVSSGPVVLLTFDPDTRVQWLIDYWPQLAELDTAIMPRLSVYEEVLGPVELLPVPIPHDCTDGFLYAYWRRPHAYLDPRVRRAISSFWKIEGAEVGLARLASDLDDGSWHRRYGELLERDVCDAGYYLVVSPDRPASQQANLTAGGPALAALVGRQAAARGEPVFPPSRRRFPIDRRAAVETSTAEQGAVRAYLVADRLVQVDPAAQPVLEHGWGLPRSGTTSTSRPPVSCVTIRQSAHFPEIGDACAKVRQSS